jgi:hypothetical protein
MSSIFSAPVTSSHEPNRTASVPTFMAHRSCRTENCLK